MVNFVSPENFYYVVVSSLNSYFRVLCAFVWFAIDQSASWAL